MIRNPGENNDFRVIFGLINFTEILVKINFTEIVVISTEINNLERKVVLMSSQQFCMHTENTQIQNVRD